MLISRETYQKIDPQSPEDRHKYNLAVLDEVHERKSEFIADPDFGGIHARNMRPVVYFGWGLSGYVKRLRMEPFCD